jgi:hypothetical protein
LIGVLSFGVKGNALRLAQQIANVEHFRGLLTGQDADRNRDNREQTFFHRIDPPS